MIYDLKVSILLSNTQKLARVEMVVDARGMECKRHRQEVVPGRLSVKGTHDESNIYQNERDLETV